MSQRKNPEFQKAERLLYEHYDKLKKINALKMRNERILCEIKKISNHLGKTNEYPSFGDLTSASTFNERVQSTPTGESSVEKAFIRYEEKLEKTKQDLEDIYFDNKNKIIKLTIETDDIKIFIDNCTEYDKKIIEERYKNKESCERCLINTNISKKGFYERLSIIVDNLNKWCEMEEINDERLQKGI